MAKQKPSDGTIVVATRLRPDENALVEATAAVMQTTKSGAIREILLAGARRRLRTAVPAES